MNGEIDIEINNVLDIELNENHNKCYIWNNAKIKIDRDTALSLLQQLTQKLGEDANFMKHMTIGRDYIDINTENLKSIIDKFQGISTIRLPLPRGPVVASCVDEGIPEIVTSKEKKEKKYKYFY